MMPSRQAKSEQKKSRKATALIQITEDEWRARVARKAYDLFEQRGEGHEVEDWLQAEGLLKEELLAQGKWDGLSRRQS